MPVLLFPIHPWENCSLNYILFLSGTQGCSDSFGLIQTAFSADDGTQISEATFWTIAPDWILHCLSSSTHCISIVLCLEHRVWTMFFWRSCITFRAVPFIHGIWSSTISWKLCLKMFKLHCSCLFLKNKNVFGLLKFWIVFWCYKAHGDRCSAFTVKMLLVLNKHYCKCIFISTNLDLFLINVILATIIVAF